MQLTVKAGFHARQNCPVSVCLPQGMPDGSYALITPASDRIPAYAADGILTFVLPSLGAGESLTLCVEAADSAQKPACASDVKGDRIAISVAGRPYTEYYFGEKTPKPYLGPLYGPYGEQVTRLNFDEKEHKHHRSLWFSHGIVNGVDTWGELEGKHGYIENKGITNAVSSDAYTAFTAHNVWTDGEHQPLADDSTIFRFYNTPAEACVFDAELTLTASYGEVTLGATKEGGPLAVRVNYNLTVPNTGRFETGSGGVNEKEIWMSRAPWCDYYGIQDGRTVGVAILDNPKNTRYPAWWHARDYGLMAANFFNLGGDMHIPTGKSETFRFRVVVHAGSAKEAGIAEKFTDYAYPPEVSVEE
ncbi:MAG: PmoA family protein [Clostridiaceae bacterium]|nr:PmoA family protein [Clostridiaceae bacterium]